MPKGTRGWPITHDYRPSGRETLAAVAFLGVVVPTVFAVLIVTTGDQKEQWPLMYAVFGGVATVAWLIGLTTGGRLRFTPTTALWVPTVGPPRWVRFEDAARMRVQGAFKFDGPRPTSIPPVRAWPHGRRKRDRERIEGWLDAWFRVAERPPRDVAATVSRSIVRVIAYVVAAPLSTWFVFTSVAPQVHRVLSRFGLNAGRLHGWEPVLLTIVIVLGPVVGPMAVFLVGRLFVDRPPAPGPRWRQRREQLEGFEVLHIADHLTAVSPRRLRRGHGR